MRDLRDVVVDWQKMVDMPCKPNWKRPKGVLSLTRIKVLNGIKKRLFVCVKNMIQRLES